jgi:type IV secretory pathway TrbF-like protein
MGVAVKRTDVFLDLARALRNWQLLAFLLTVANVVLLAGFVRLALATRYVPYVVELDAHGNATYAGPLEAVDTAEERLIIQQLRQFVWNLRLVVADAAAQQELVARAYALADVPLRRQLDEYFSRPENDPRLLAPKASRAVERVTLLRLPHTTDTYQVQWTEVVTSRTAFGAGERHSFQGLLTAEQAERLTPEALAHNPLGLLVTEFTWTETTAEPSSGGTP